MAETRGKEESFSPRVFGITCHAPVHSGGSRALLINPRITVIRATLCEKSGLACPGFHRCITFSTYLPVHGGEFTPCCNSWSFNVRGRPVPAHNAAQSQRRISARLKCCSGLLNNTCAVIISVLHIKFSEDCGGSCTP